MTSTEMFPCIPVKDITSVYSRSDIYGYWDMVNSLQKVIINFSTLLIKFKLHYKSNRDRETFVFFRLSLWEEEQEVISTMAHIVKFGF